MKTNPFKSLEELYDWVRAEMNVEMACVGTIENSIMGGKRLIEIFIDEYKFSVPHFTLGIADYPPIPIAKIAIPEPSFLDDKKAKLDVLWTREEYSITPEQLEIISDWIRGSYYLNAKLTNLDMVQITWEGQVDFAELWKGSNAKWVHGRFVGTHDE
jgi:hypothetical protein